MDQRTPDLPVFHAVYTPPRWPTLPETGTAYVSRAWLPEPDGTVGYFAYTSDALGFFAVGASDAARGVHKTIDDELARILAAHGSTTDARDAVLSSALFDAEELVDLPVLYSTIREAWGV